ncbi:uncharacterized protein LOC127103887 [Lathyrus oleraceus]|uniref:uncharacterized protein LOC127103887 n=1 Tax=Pisum sativum TaxID=3888 RepID=UPI0021D02DE2|nr:uncharacterized protein LOC127103887 [Pisum sativum]
MLPPKSVHTWTQLERLFHEQFYMGQSKISFKKLSSVKRKAAESVDQYLNRFRLLKARCFTQVPEHEIVEIATSGLDYSIRKKYHKKDKVSYISVDEYSSYDEDLVDESKVNVAELKPGPPYTCKLLKPSNRKSLIETEKADKYVSKTYTFDVSKCDEIFDLLVKDGKIIIPQGLKDPPLDQEKKRGLCKFHNFLGHKTSQCVIFRDLVQKVLK